MLCTQTFMQGKLDFPSEISKAEPATHTASTPQSCGRHHTHFLKKFCPDSTPLVSPSRPALSEWRPRPPQQSGGGRAGGGEGKLCPPSECRPASRTGPTGSRAFTPRPRSLRMIFSCSGSSYWVVHVDICQGKVSGRVVEPGTGAASGRVT